MPPLLWKAFVTAEDRDFFQHHGVDWQARMGALLQNIRAAKQVRGASTISEQVVRIIHPRPRTLWSRWLEGIEAQLLEQHHSKGEILAFYLNQVPYAANRRGVAQAARYYFNRDLGTLTHKEMLALAVLPRAPSALDLYKHPQRIEPKLNRLAEAMVARGELTPEAAASMRAQKLVLEPPAAPIHASHFIYYIRETTPYRVSNRGTVRTTLDSALQQQVQHLLAERLHALARKNVHNAAALVVDHTTGEILAWVVAAHKESTTAAIDAVRTPRQPGSALKPFLYALALDLGWSPATVLHDVPMEESIGNGLHDFRNYSHTFYGAISLREALGNSLNIPAIETIGFVTPARYLKRLHLLGFDTLDASADYYKDGLALGSGEVTLLAMVEAYSALANHGQVQPLTPLFGAGDAPPKTQVYSEEAATLIGNILSDPYARRREFGSGSVLNLPVQTAVKTGTSTDYRDAWVMGYNARYTVGIWMGNLDNKPMDGVTGSIGPALVLRSVFNALGARDVPRALYLSPRLMLQQICSNPGKALGEHACYPRSEYFMPGSKMLQPKPQQTAAAFSIVRPTEGLHIAYDPRRPPALQAFEFSAHKSHPNHLLEWRVNGTLLATTDEAKYLWPVQRGKHILTVRETDRDGKDFSSAQVRFVVK
jgi:penicillin-binding protein 1C